MSNHVDDNQENEDDIEHTVDSLVFEPTEEMFQAADGSWRWRAGTIDPLTGKERQGAHFVKGAPSPNPNGRPRKESDHQKYIDRYVLPELERRIIEMLADPSIKHADLIAAYRILTDRRFGKPGQTIKNEGVNLPANYTPMVIGQDIIDRLNQQEQDNDDND